MPYENCDSEDYYTCDYEYEYEYTPPSPGRQKELIDAHTAGRDITQDIDECVFIDNYEEKLIELKEENDKKMCVGKVPYTYLNSGNDVYAKIHSIFPNFIPYKKKFLKCWRVLPSDL
jgi:hypothetical protein